MTAVQLPVTVLVTGTVADRTAVRLAANEALLHERPIRVLTTYTPPDPTAGPIGWAPQLTTAQRAMGAALRWLRESHPALPVDYRVAPGDPAEILIGMSPDAALAVVPAVTHARPGAVTGAPTLPERVAAHARCPVLISHSGLVAGGDVVVGVDGVSSADPLLRFGFQAAAARGVPLRAVLVWGALPEAGLGTLDPFAFNRPSANEDADRLLAEELAGWAEKQPDVTVRRHAVCGSDVAATLARTASDAALLVVGARSRPARSGQALGPVPRRLIRAAPCPVVVLQLD
ncbi:universal stress protein [Virgisporangium ochraceum]|uniref:Universal stress protein n=1 Tax=Virgisporangium ochraceum TaxID=65505 RepID=A0A8J4EDM4_9ACTN|nr:universal stress protein [Virgisporangium ochraceum]GIJ71710.1 universal stress protein [Virgisporangium ochraceum]